MRKIFLLVLLSLTINLSAQMERFPLLEPISDFIPESVLIEGIENELIMFWIDSTDLHMSKSIDEGANWNTPITLVDNEIFLDSLSDLNVLKLKSGRILVTYKFRLHYIVYSDNNGLTWSEPVQLVTDIGTIRPRRVYESSLSQTDEGMIWFVYNRLKVIYSIRSNDGINWSDKDTLTIIDNSQPHYSSVNSRWDDSLVLVYKTEINDTSYIYETISADSGKTWNEPSLIIHNEQNSKRPRVFRDSEKTLWLTYYETEPTPFDEYAQTNIYYSKLPDGTDSWSTPNKFTEYVGFDGWQNIGYANDKPYITFISNRGSDALSLWYGIADETEDNLTPPIIFETDIHYQNNHPTVNIFPSAKVYDSNEISNVSFNFTDKGGVERTLELFDDGFHNDEEAGDYIYSNELLGIYNSFYYEVNFTAMDIQSNISKTQPTIITTPFPPDGGDAFLFDNNNLKFPIDDKGILADVSVYEEPYSNGVHFDEDRIIYSAGFALSGYTNDSLWANGMMSVSRIVDYVHGTIESSEANNKIHVVRSSQPDFYQSWMNWKDAVSQGADFYDGDGDGIYDPVDKNSNGLWDENEDKPNIIGDITAFTVFNDGVSADDRNYNHVEPQGIEIKQTVFSYNKTTLPELENVIYVKYSIENMSTVADTLTSVYFGAWADMDIGTYHDDLFGTDSILNSSYCYNDGEDESNYSIGYGSNPPACFISFIQGPPIYIENETYIDVDGNGIYDDGIDTPLDTAVNRKGKLSGLDKYPGARNNKLTASIHFICGHPTQGDPDDEQELRDYMLGFSQQGELINPCNWEFGQVFNEDCNSINPRFMYSGDPVTQNGWINWGADDQRQLGPTGPFELIKNKPIDIIIAYVAGRGTDHLSSITEARINTQKAIDFYETNFDYTPVVGTEEKEKTQLPEKFVLYQNYPNPFNPSTKIEYSLPAGKAGIQKSEYVMLKVYDVLGREVATLVNKEQQAGSYQVQFDASNLTSGIYFYRIQAGSFVESRKMILIK